MRQAREGPHSPVTSVCYDRSQISPDLRRWARRSLWLPSCQAPHVRRRAVGPPSNTSSGGLTRRSHPAGESNRTNRCRCGYPPAYCGTWTSCNCLWMLPTGDTSVSSYQYTHILTYRPPQVDSRSGVPTSLRSAGGAARVSRRHRTAHLIACFRPAQTASGDCEQRTDEGTRVTRGRPANPAGLDGAPGTPGTARGGERAATRPVGTRIS